MKDKNRIATTVKIPIELYDEFKILGIKNHISLQNLVEKCINLFVKDESFRTTVASFSLSSISTANAFTSSMIFPTTL